MSNPFTVIVADVQKVIAAIVAGLKWFEREAELVIGWVDKEVPGAQQAIAGLIQDGDEAMTTLASHAEKGLGDFVANALDGAQTTILNGLSATGLDLTSKKTLNADTVAGIASVHEIIQAANTAALAKVLASTNAAATQLQASNAANPQPAPQPE